MRDYELAKIELALSAGLTVGYDEVAVAAEPRDIDARR
jgi:hypothetical protein